MDWESWRNAERGIGGELAMAAYMEHKDLANESIGPERTRQITDGVHRVLDRIAEAEHAAGREAGFVRLLAATKTRDVGEIMAAIDAGVRMIGENRPQDPFHLIGQLQSNKINKVLSVVDAIESVDSIELAEKIARRAVAAGITVGVLLEVNESGEASKSGCDPALALDIARRIGAMGGVDLQGLMTIGAHVDDERVIRAGFAHLRRLREQILASGHDAGYGTGDCRRIDHRACGHGHLRRARVQVRQAHGLDCEA